MEQAYLSLLRQLLEHGVSREDRTGTGTRALFGQCLRHDLATGFPLLTTKKLHVKSVIHELLWFLRGESNIGSLNAHGVSIWDEWATEDGELGPVYGVQWRRWRGGNDQRHDQVKALIDGLRDNPNSRRHIINAWNVADLPDEHRSPQENVHRGKMALPPCHVMYQFWVANSKLSAMLTQRSGDVFLGIPFNIASLAFLTHMLAAQCGLKPGELVHVIGDAHLYDNHREQARVQLAREPRPLPTLELLRRPNTIDDYRFEDFCLHSYDPHPPIPAPVAV